MEKRFIVPASTFLGGIAVWLVLFFLFKSQTLDLWQELIFGVITGGLIVFSAFSCKRAGGPKAGNLFRAGFLLVMGIFTYFYIGMVSAIIILASIITILIIALNTKQPEPKKDNIPA
ncbi:MAG: hypothetical protein WB779_03910 [Ignavibacteriaceae bacterium]